MNNSNNNNLASKNQISHFSHYSIRINGDNRVKRVFPARRDSHGKLMARSLFTVVRRTYIINHT
jgi:hypothetical protein